MTEKKKTRKKSPEPGSGKKKPAGKAGLRFPKDFPVRDVIKTSVKCATVLAAFAALFTMFVLRADVTPMGILQGMSDKYLFTSASGDGYPVDVPGSRILKTAHITRGTAVLTDSSFTLYDRKGRSVFSEAHFLSSPVMENREKFSLLFERLGSSYVVRNLSGVVCKGKVDDSIICGSVSANGRFVLVTNSKTTNAVILVYASDGRLLQSWKSIEQKISDVVISPSGKVVVWNGMSTENGTLVSTVNVRKIGDKKNLKEFTLEDALITDLAFDGESRVIAVGDTLSAVLHISGNENFAYAYDDRILNYYDFSENGELALVFSDRSDGSNASVVVLDRQCREKASFATTLDSPRVDLSRGRVSLLCDSRVSVYNFKGELVREADVPKDCQTIFTSEGGLIAKGMMWLAKVD